MPEPEEREALKLRLKDVQARIRQIKKTNRICFDECLECIYYDECDEKAHYSKFPEFQEEREIYLKLLEIE